MRAMLSVLAALGVITLAGLLLAQEADAPEEPPIRLKKKIRTPPPEKGEPAPTRPDEKKPDDKKGEEPQPMEAVPDEPEESRAEILERIARNMKRVEDQLASAKLSEGTLQTEDDIIEDLERLIRQNEKQQSGGSDSQDSQGQPGMPPQGGQSQKSKSQTARRPGQSRQGSRPSTSQAQASRQPGQGSPQQGTPQQGTPQQGSKPGQQPGQGNSQANGQGGNGQNGQTPTAGAGQQPGAGGQDAQGGPKRSADLYKDVWGHLPETVRAQMNAYASREAYMAKHRELIKQYYRAIAEQGQ